MHFDDKPHKIGLILSGGGARAAYQVGVLRAIANLLPKDSPLPFPIISGTSAGALNAVSLATHAYKFSTGVRILEFVWKNMHSGQIYSPNSAGIISTAGSWAKSIVSGRNTQTSLSLLDNKPLKELLGRVIKFDRIQRCIDLGLIDAVSVTASAYGSGESVSFFQAMKGIESWQGPHRMGLRTKLSLSHLVASTAIPTIFPAIKIDKQYYGDGAIRQISPTSTTLQLGANKILAIGVSANRSKPQALDTDPSPPKLSQIIGHMLNSAFVDALENDLESLRHMNEVLAQYPNSKIGHQLTGHKQIDLLEISPSQDLSELAIEHYDELPKSMKSYIKGNSSGTILSLLLFEPGYCNSLLELGYHDAMQQQQEIAEFFNIDVRTDVTTDVRRD